MNKDPKTFWAVYGVLIFSFLSLSFVVAEIMVIVSLLYLVGFGLLMLSLWTFVSSWKGREHLITIKQVSEKPDVPEFVQKYLEEKGYELRKGGESDG